MIVAVHGDANAVIRGPGTAYRGSLGAEREARGYWEPRMREEGDNVNEREKEEGEFYLHVLQRVRSGRLPSKVS